MVHLAQSRFNLGAGDAQVELQAQRHAPHQKGGEQGDHSDGDHPPEERVHELSPGLRV